jgi:two-component system, OmpR family, phosphate regulon sensor histidine kinase PhoR
VDFTDRETVNCRLLKEKVPMFLSKKWIFSIISIAGVSLLILLLIQFVWIRKSIEGNRRHFDDKMTIAGNSIRKAFLEDEFLRAPDTIADLRSHLFFSSRQGPVDFKRNLKAKIDSVLIAAGMPVTAEIVGEEGRICYLMSNIPATAHNMQFDRAAYKICLCSNDDPRALDIGFDLMPNKILMGDSSSLIFPSLILIILLIALFAYIIIVIEKQKSLALIKNDFINNLTHEFNTPLFSIGLTSKLLLRSESVAQSEKLKEYVGIISREKARLQTQVDKILRLTAVESGNMLMEKERVDIHLLLEQSISGYLLAISERSGSVTFQPQATRMSVYADRIHLFNAFSNLIDNAIKYSNEPPEIIVLTSNSDHEMVISIRDHGIGMDAKDIKLIFNRFYRVRQGDRHDVKGFGIGLSYVREIIDLHRGSIDVRSEPGTGSEFIIHLPLMT